MLSFHIVIFIFSLSAFRTVASPYYNEDGWNVAADYLLEAMDTTANPCEDFYQYACGNWKKKYRYSGDTAHLTARIPEQILQVVKNINENDPATPEYKRSLKAFFNQCVNDTTSNADNLRSIYRKLESIMGPMPLLSQGTETATATPNIYYILGQVARKFGVPLYLKVGIASQVDQCVPKPVVVIQPERVVNPLVNSVKHRNAIALMAQLLNVSIANNQINNKMTTVGTFFRDITLKLEIAVKNATAEAKMRLSDLPTVGNVSWDDYFNGLLPADFLQAWKRHDAKIIIRAPEYFRALHEHLAKIPPAHFANFVYATLLHKVYEDKSTNADVDQNRKEAICNKLMMHSQGAACARVLIESYGTDVVHWRRDLELIGESVFAAFRFMVHTTDWLDLENRLAVIDKIDQISFSPGLPEWMLNSTLLERHMYAYDSNATFFDNIVWLMEKKSLEELRQAGDQELLPGAYNPFTPDYRPYPTFMPNAFYHEQAIMLLLGEFLPPRYNYSFPLSVKFGQAGWTIGHEMFHGFDYTEAAKAFGVKRRLSPAALRRFEKLVNCVKRVYSGFCFDATKGCISGSRTISDNIADLEGLKVSYMAYKFLLQTSGPERPLPGILANFTEDQLYFLSMARPWCSDDVASDYALKHGVHSPARARVEVPITNFPTFAQAFHCPAGSIYAPLATCNLWGDFLEPRLAT